MVWDQVRKNAPSQGSAPAGFFFHAARIQMSLARLALLRPDLPTSTLFVCGKTILRVLSLGQTSLRNLGVVSCNGLATLHWRGTRWVGVEVGECTPHRGFSEAAYFNL